jgi:hypothetical protein
MLIRHELTCFQWAQSDGMERVIESDGASKRPLHKSAHSQKRPHCASVFGPPDTDTVLNETFQYKLHMDGNNFPK